MATKLLSKVNSHEEGQQTHSVASEAVGNCVRVCIAFRVWKQNLNAVLTVCLHLDNCTRSDSIRRPVAKRSNGNRKIVYFNVTTIGLRIKRRKNQANKSTGWMPWHHTPMKDVASCDKLRGAASRHRSVDF